MDDRRDVAALCEDLYRSVYGGLLLFCGNREVAEDVAQETMLRVLRRWESVSEMDRPDRWAMAVAFNLAKSGFRRHRIARGIRAQLGRDRVEETDPTNAVAVREAVAELPTRQRAAIVLRYFNDMSIRDTAEVMSCAEGTVKALTAQAVVNLRKQLGGQVPDEDGS